MTGIELIKQERQRQIEVEGWTPEHDDLHDGGELSQAAAVYADAASALIRGATPIEIECCYTDGMGGLDWPWEPHTMKIDNDPLRVLVKAGALIAAEIDGLQRLGGDPSL